MLLSRTRRFSCSGAAAAAAGSPVAHASGVDSGRTADPNEADPPACSDSAASRSSASGTPGRRKSIARRFMCRLFLATPPLPWARRRLLSLRTAVARDHLIVHGRAEQLAHACYSCSNSSRVHAADLAGVMVAQEAVQAPRQIGRVAVADRIRPGRVVRGYGYGRTRSHVPRAHWHWRSRALRLAGAAVAISPVLRTKKRRRAGRCGGIHGQQKAQPGLRCRSVGIERGGRGRRDR